MIGTRKQGRAVMSLVQRVDIFLSKSIKALLLFLKHLCVIGLGLGTIGLTLSQIFEYGEGLADLANIELIFFALLPLLVYRHYTYCQYFQVGLWKTLISPVYALGILAAITIFLFSLIVTSLVLDDPELKLTELLQASRIVELVSLGLFIISLYLSSPLKEAENKKLEAVPGEGMKDSLKTEPTYTKHADGLIDKQY